MIEKESIVQLSDDYFGPFLPYIQDEDITDVDYNGTELWTKHLDGTKVKQEDEITDLFIEQFSNRIANKVSKPFNQQNKVLEANTESLRISILHESATTSGRSICIRKSPPKLRFTIKEAIENGYCSRQVMCMLINCILARMNIVICGEMGSGKTECARFLAQFIPNGDRVITIEDSPEWHYKQINPNHDCVEIRVNEQFTYSDALKASLRQDAVWVLLTESRSTEVKELFEDISSGSNIITTLHTDDVRRIPDRMLNMTGSRMDADRLINNVYDGIDVGIMMGWKNGKRYIEQICFFNRDNERNMVYMMVADGRLLDVDLPLDIMRKFKKVTADLFECEIVRKELQEDEEIQLKA